MQCAMSSERQDWATTDPLVGDLDILYAIIFWHRLRRIAQKLKRTTGLACSGRAVKGVRCERLLDGRWPLGKWSVSVAKPWTICARHGSREVLRWFPPLPLVYRVLAVLK
jgi:hypothetical protein